ncbi:MAG: hypothetical protein AAF907_01570, partial [Planctomycetota bacterium]
MTDSPLFWIAAIPLGIAAFFYLFSPALVRLTTVPNADAAPAEFDSDETPPPRPVAQFWAEVAEAAAPLGF